MEQQVREKSDVSPYPRFSPPTWHKTPTFVLSNTQSRGNKVIGGHARFLCRNSLANVGNRKFRRTQGYDEESRPSFRFCQHRFRQSRGIDACGLQRVAPGRDVVNRGMLDGGVFQRQARQGRRKRVHFSISINQMKRKAKGRVRWQGTELARRGSCGETEN